MLDDSSPSGFYYSSDALDKLQEPTKNFMAE
jgi:hypothetical protein